MCSMEQKERLRNDPPCKATCGTTHTGGRGISCLGRGQLETGDRNQLCTLCLTCDGQVPEAVASSALWRFPGHQAKQLFAEKTTTTAQHIPTCLFPLLSYFTFISLLHVLISVSQVYKAFIANKKLNKISKYFLFTSNFLRSQTKKIGTTSGFQTRPWKIGSCSLRTHVSKGNRNSFPGSVNWVVKILNMQWHVSELFQLSHTVNSSEVQVVDQASGYK